MLIVVGIIILIGYFMYQGSNGGGYVEKVDMQLSSGEGSKSSANGITVNCSHCKKNLSIGHEGNWTCVYCNKEFVYFKKMTYKREEIHSIYATYIISILAKFSKIDGIVTKGELAIIENNISTYFDMTDSELIGIKKIFNSEVKNIEDCDEVLNKLSELVKEDSQLKENIGNFLLGTMYQISIVDKEQHEIHVKHREILFKVMGIFNVDMNFFENKREENSMSLEEAYTILEYKKGDSLIEVKKKYRELSKKYHPDTLAAKDLAPEIMELASSKFKEITEAYNIIIQSLKDH